MNYQEISKQELVKELRTAIVDIYRELVNQLYSDNQKNNPSAFPLYNDNESTFFIIENDTKYFSGDKYHAVFSYPHKKLLDWC